MSQLYLFITENQHPKVLNTKQVHDFIINEEIDPYDYVYEFSTHQWIKACEISLFKTLGARFPISENEDQGPPQAAPPSIDLRPYVHEAVKAENKLILIYLKKKNIEKKKIVQKSKEMKQHLETKQRECQKLNESYNNLAYKHKKLKAYIQEHGDPTHCLSDEIKQLKDELHQSQKITASYEGLKEKLAVYQNELHKYKKHIQQIQDPKQERSDTEVKRFTGESYELSNGKVWYYKQSGKEHGPLDFEEMLELKRQEKISEVTLLKNTSTNSGWRALKDHFEFDAPFETILSEEDGVTVKRFFIKRNSIRVPIYEVMALELEEKEYKGYCTSLSLGGCFMEMTRLKEGDFQKGDQVNIRLVGDALGEQITATATIRNIGLSRPKGLGLMFDELDENSRKLFENYIAESLERMGMNKDVA